MRYLKKFESNDNDELDIEYIKECFVEYLDESEFDVDELNDGRKCIDIWIMLPGVKYENGKYHKPSHSEFYKLSDKIKEMETFTNFYKDIEGCIEKVKIQIPDIEVETSNEMEYISTNNGPQGCEEGFEASMKIFFCLPKRRITKDMEKNKLNLFNSSDLDKSWI